MEEPESPYWDPRPIFRYPAGLSEIRVEHTRPSHADFDALESALVESLIASLQMCDQVISQSSPVSAESSTDKDSVYGASSIPSCAASDGVFPDEMDESGYLYDDDDGILPSDAHEERAFTNNDHDGEAVAGAIDDLQNVRSGLSDDRRENLKALYRAREEACDSINDISMRLIDHPAAKLEKKMDWREPMMCVHFTAKDRERLSHGLEVAADHITQRLAFARKYIEQDDMLPAGHLRNDVWISFRQEMILEEYVNVCVQPSEKEWDMLERGLRLPVETIGDFFIEKSVTLEKALIATDILHAKSRTVFVELQKQIQEEMLRAKIRAVKHQD